MPPDRVFHDLGHLLSGCRVRVLLETDRRVGASELARGGPTQRVRDRVHVVWRHRDAGVRLAHDSRRLVSFGKRDDRTSGGEILEELSGRLRRVPRSDQHERVRRALEGECSCPIDKTDVLDDVRSVASSDRCRVLGRHTPGNRESEPSRLQLGPYEAQRSEKWKRRTATNA